MKTDKTVTRNFEKFQRPAKKFRFRAGSTDPWPKVLRDFDDFVSINPVYQPMRRFVYSLYACASGNLHARQTMGGNLILSPEEELHQDDNLLLISYCSEQRLFHIEHRTLSKNDDSKEV
jgi:hypothetical protein